jgi:hypothetical protein
MYKVLMEPNNTMIVLVGAPALALVAHSLLDNVLVGVALLASLVTTFGLFYTVSVVCRVVEKEGRQNLRVCPR